MEIKTINVIEYCGDNIIGIKSFSSDEEGLNDAENHFKLTICKQLIEPTEDELKQYVSDNYFEQGDYQIFIVNS